MPQLPEYPCMSKNEIELLSNYIPQGGSAIEFGGGGSTKFFFQHGIYKLLTIELDKSWAQSIVSDKFCSFFIKKQRLNILVPQIGGIQDNNWSYPTGRATPQWLTYHQGCWEYIDCNNINFVLIDGRFRLACALQSIINLNSSPLLFIHDETDAQ